MITLASTTNDKSYLEPTKSRLDSMKIIQTKKNLIALTAILCIASSMMLTQEAHAIGYQHADTYIKSYPSLYWSEGTDVSTSNHNLFHDKAYNAVSALEQLQAKHGLNYGHQFAKYGWSSAMISTVNTSYGKP